MFLAKLLNNQLQIVIELRNLNYSNYITAHLCDLYTVAYLFTSVYCQHRGGYARSRRCRLPTTINCNMPRVISLSRWMQKINFEAFSCRHFHFKTVLQSAPEHTIFIQKTENFSWVHPSHPLAALHSSLAPSPYKH